MLQITLTVSWQFPINVTLAPVVKGTQLARHVNNWGKPEWAPRVCCMVVVVIFGASVVRKRQLGLRGAGAKFISTILHIMHKQVHAGINHMCVKCHLCIECYIRSSLAYILCVHPSLQVWILQDPSSLCRTERKGYGTGGNEKGLAVQWKLPNKGGWGYYGKSESTTELDALSVNGSNHWKIRIMPTDQGQSKIDQWP